MPDQSLAGTPIEPGEQPFDWRLVQADFGNGARYVLEVRPTSGEWKPFLLGVPKADRPKVIAVMPGVPGHPPESAIVGNPVSGEAQESSFFCWQLENAATQDQSYFAYLKDLPGVVVFGQAGAGPQYQLQPREIGGVDEGEN